MIVVGGKSLIARHFDRLPALKLDLDYALWLFTVAATLISATSLLGALVIYIIEQIRFLNGLGLAFHGHNYLKMLEIAALFGFAAAGLHFLRIHLNIEPEGFEVEIPSPIIADLPGTQENWRFECVSEMSLLVSDEAPVIAMRRAPEKLTEDLSAAFLQIISDPEIRFSREKMEDTLTIVAQHRLGPGVKRVHMTSIRQRRMPVQQVDTSEDTSAEEPEDASIEAHELDIFEGSDSCS